MAYSGGHPFVGPHEDGYSTEFPSKIPRAPGVDTKGVLELSKPDQEA